MDKKIIELKEVTEVQIAKNAEFYTWSYTGGLSCIDRFFCSMQVLSEWESLWYGATISGVPQHLNSLAYYGEYLRGILYSLFVEHSLFDSYVGSCISAMARIS